MASGAWEVMGTIFTVGAWGPDSAALAVAVNRAYDSLRLVDSLLSTYRDDSEISRVNRGAGSAGRPVSDAFAAVLGEALRVARRSGGAFDPTLRNWRGVAFDSAARTVRLTPGLRLDFGGIAKGYALDRAALALAGVADSAVLSLGGDSRSGQSARAPGARRPAPGPPVGEHVVAGRAARSHRGSADRAGRGARPIGDRGRAYGHRRRRVVHGAVCPRLR